MQWIFIGLNDTETELLNVTLPSYNLTEDTKTGEYELKLDNLSPEATMKGSKLLEMDVTKSSKEEIQEEFCKEIKAISLKYSEPQVVSCIPSFLFQLYIIVKI